MNIVIISSGFLPAESQGGVPFSAYNLAASFIKLGHSVSVITTDRNGVSRLKVETNNWTSFNNIPVIYYKTFSGPYVFIKSRLRYIIRAIMDCDLVISSSTLWNHLGFLAAYYAVKHKKIHFVYPRGLLDSWALNQKPFRKLIFSQTQGRYIAKSASIFIALTHAERNSISIIYPASHAFVIPNGCPEVINPSAISTGYRLSNKQVSDYLLFLGRISRKKGLEQSVLSFVNAKLEPKKLLLIVGPIDEEYKSDFFDLVKPYSDSIVVLPPHFGDQKANLLQFSRALILTSKSEGMPMAVLEALSYGKPVIITPECNLPEVETYNAGWIICREDIRSTTGAIEMCFNNSPHYHERSKNAVLLAEKQFSWEGIAKTTVNLYETLACQS